MRYYFAAKYSRHPELRGYRDELAQAIPEAVVTSRWIDPAPGDEEDCSPDALDADPAGAWKYAEADCEDVFFADVFVHFCGPVGRGGRHVEHGYALALGRRIVIVGSRENIFHCHPATEVYPSWADFLSAEIGDAS